MTSNSGNGAISDPNATVGRAVLSRTRSATESFPSSI